jgi:hypothetical protein
MTTFRNTLETLVAIVARSPIIVPGPARDFADWCERQKPADIDAVILVWLRSQAQVRAPAKLS